MAPTLAQEASATANHHHHVVAFAFPYGTHAVPLLNLVVKIARAAPSAWFSFFTTPNTIPSLSDIPHNVQCYDVVSDGIPDDHPLRHSPHYSIQRLDLFLHAGPLNLQHALSITNRKVTCVIADAYVTSSLVLAQRLGVPWIAVWTSNATSLSTYFHAHLIRHNCIKTQNYKSLSFVPGLSDLRIQDLPNNIKQEETDSQSEFLRMLMSMGQVLPEAKSVVINSFPQLEPPSLVQDLQSKLNNVIYAGFLSLSLPLPPLPPSHTDPTGTLSWLDTQPPHSVAYISLGTVVMPPQHELVAIAEALDETGVPFLWSLKDGLRASLPRGFGERKKGRIVGWAPQTMVLGHGSVGVFVTHGGNNSICESVASGVPMICRPYFGDQIVNARILEGVWEIGVKIEGGVFTKDAFVKSLRLVLGQKEGKVMRDKARDLKKVVLEAAEPKGKIDQEFNSLVDLVLS